jgi:hypothetical protein
VVCKTTVVFCTARQLDPWKSYRFSVTAYEATHLRWYNLGTSAAAKPYLKVRKPTKLSSIVPASQRPTKWKAGSGCRIKKNVLTLTKTRCTVKLSIGGKPASIELRR